MHLFSKENIWSNPHASSHPDKNNNSVNRIISKEEEREDPRRELQSSSSTVVFPHAIQSSRAKETILHTELILLQEFSKKYYNYKTHPVQISTRHLPVTAPVHPSILHGRIRLPASLQHSRAIQYKQASSNSRRQNQHSTRQPASTQSLQ